MPAIDRQQAILDLLKNLRGLDPLKQLFWSQLNYERVNSPLSRRAWAETTREALASDPVLFAAGGAGSEFHVIYAQLDSDRLLLGLERPVVTRLLQDHPYALFVFSNKTQDRWHFVNAKYDGEAGKRRLFRRITVGVDERLRTASERIAMLDLAEMSRDLFGLSPLMIQNVHDQAFDVETVTENFFNDYKRVFADLQERLRRQTHDAIWAHDYALQLLNRLLFLYFIQRKRWLGDDPDFIRNFWSAYKNSHRAQNTFFDEWLSVLFFEAFNEKFQAGRQDRQYLPEILRNALAQAPFLNGGLFTRNALDEQYAFGVPDTFFESLFDRFNNQSPGFLERYNFTITEDTPFDQEVAVDPEMIGKVYESLVNITFEGVGETDQRGTAGIFYTPRVEIDLMCRLVLLDYLTNHLGDQQRPLLRNAIFAYDAEEKNAADAELAQANLWPGLNPLLRDATFLDPACGSGSFLVGMLSILDDLQARADAQLGLQETPYERRKRIIGQSLYGVDVMKWAVHVAELRLWLQLVIETSLHPAELKFRPLLPNLSFKVRVGDSLVQEVGGINFSLHHSHAAIPAPLKGKLTQLKAEKLKFFNGDPSAKFRTEAALRQQELVIFRSILDERAKALEEQIETKRRKAKERDATQIALLAEEKAVYNVKGVAAAEAEAEALQIELEQVRTARDALKHAGDVPFVWDIAFVEIFEGERDGFDMVAGNPPYVRQERIAPPMLSEGDYSANQWLELKRKYKAQLQASVAAAFPKFFGYKPRTGDYARKLDGKSDLYIYFYLHGLSLLNSQGAFAFITSNSWLDVGYGAELQEFLLKHSHVRLLIDNQVRRSFKQADVNTVIALLGSADDAHASGLEKTARFVMFKVPFEQALSPVVIGEIESAAERLTRLEFRVIARRQSELLKEGMESPAEETSQVPKTRAVYTGNKWGGKYLRAPDIYWTILEKNKDKLVRLGDIADVRFGIKTGANEFFYFENAQPSSRGTLLVTSEGGWQGQIEKKYLRRVLRSPRECYSITVPNDAGAWAFWCQDDRDLLRGTAALDYIRYGEKRGYHEVSSVKGRRNWYSLPIQQRADLFWPRAFFERFMSYLAPSDMFASDRFFVINAQGAEYLRIFLNTLMPYLWVELFGLQVNHGGVDTKVVLIDDIAVPKELNITPAIQRMFDALAKRPIGLVGDEIERKDRQEFDYAVLSQIGLTAQDVRNLHQFVADSTRDRILKAHRGLTQRVRPGTIGADE